MPPCSEPTGRRSADIGAWRPRRDTATAQSDDAPPVVERPPTGSAPTELATTDCPPSSDYDALGTSLQKRNPGSVDRRRKLSG